MKEWFKCLFVWLLRRNKLFTSGQCLPSSVEVLILEPGGLGKGRKGLNEVSSLRSEQDAEML